MDDPYRPPEAATTDPDNEIKRTSHAVVVFISGVVLFPAILFSAFVLLLPEELPNFGAPWLWIPIAFTSLISALASLPFKRMPFWLALLVGLLSGLLTLIAVVEW